MILLVNLLCFECGYIIVIWYWSLWLMFEMVFDLYDFCKILIKEVVVIVNRVIWYVNVFGFLVFILGKYDNG